MFSLLQSDFHRMKINWESWFEIMKSSKSCIQYIHWSISSAVFSAVIFSSSMVSLHIIVSMMFLSFERDKSMTKFMTMFFHYCLCYDPSYAPMLIAMLVTMLMAMFLAIAGRSSLGYRVVSKPTLFRVSLCSPEPYR